MQKLSPQRTIPKLHFLNKKTLLRVFLLNYAVHIHHLRRSSYSVYQYDCILRIRESLLRSTEQ